MTIKFFIFLEIVCHWAQTLFFLLSFLYTLVEHTFWLTPAISHARTHTHTQAVQVYLCFSRKFPIHKSASSSALSLSSLTILFCSLLSLERSRGNNETCPLARERCFHGMLAQGRALSTRVWKREHTSHRNLCFFMMFCTYVFHFFFCFENKVHFFFFCSFF